MNFGFGSGLAGVDWRMANTLSISKILSLITHLNWELQLPLPARQKEQKKTSEKK